MKLSDLPPGVSAGDPNINAGPRPLAESRHVRMYRKARAKYRALSAKLNAEKERTAPRILALEQRIVKIRKRATTLESKVRDAQTQTSIRWMNLTGGEQGHLNLEKGNGT